MQKEIAILGSTGSIGVSTLSVVEEHKDEFSISLLSAHKNITKLLEQIQIFRPAIAFITGVKPSESQVLEAKSHGCQLEFEKESLCEVLSKSSKETIVLAISGAAGLEYGLAALTNEKRLAIANKEPIVIAGHLFFEKAKKNKCEIIPIDSEHSAIFQCLCGKDRSGVEKLILTSSGGPFHYYSQDEFKGIKPEHALKHPTWSMGKKITVDSATMVNKALELIEAKWLFDIDISLIDVVIHRQSIVHSMVQYVDGSILAQMGKTDMRFPIFYALTYPQNISANLPRLEFNEMLSLTFEPVNPYLNTALNIARRCSKNHIDPIIFNAANEVFVENFLAEKIEFQECYTIIKATLDKCAHEFNSANSLDEILYIDNYARTVSSQIIKKEHIKL
jgi:1-deoxy-D-xylulose-5-phosphate reductoisomerase